MSTSTQPLPPPPAPSTRELWRLDLCEPHATACLVWGSVVVAPSTSPSCSLCTTPAAHVVSVRMESRR